MSRPLFVVCPALVLASASVLAGCPASGGDAGSSSANAATVKVEHTCKDAVGRYGEHFGKSLMDDPKSPVPADKRDKAVSAIKEAVIKSCEEDKWDSLPIDCLASIFERPGVLPKDKIDDALSVCANGAGKEKSAKMDERVARAMFEVVKGGASASPGAAAAPWVSKDGGFQIDFHGQTPDESTKDDPNGGRWHDASLRSGQMAQWTDYANAAVAAAEVKVFLPTREKDQIKRDEAVTFQGLKGRDIEMTLSSGKVFWIRFLIDDKRVFKLGAVYSGDSAPAKAFMESFKRTQAADPSGAASAAPVAEPPKAGAPAKAAPAKAEPPKPAPPKPAQPKSGDDMF